MNKFLMTINRKNGLTDEHIDRLTHYFVTRFTHVVVNSEPCKSGLIHLHAFGESLLTRPSIRAHLVRFLKNELEFEITKNLLKVQDADNGARSYVVKAVTDDKPVTAIQGWSIADLLKERQESLKKLKVQEAKGTDKVVSGDEAVPLILKFAVSSAEGLTDKHSFKRVIKDMVKMGFSFSKVKMQIVYAECMCRVGDEGPLDDWLEMQLCGLR